MKDYTGQRFGRLTVISITPERRYNRVVWQCLCDCGNTVFLTAPHFDGGKTKSCGCLAQETRTLDLTGQRFGRLTAVKATEERKRTSVVWECLCDCGNTIFASSANLTRGTTKSCGCLYKDLYNKDLTGQRFGRLTVIRALEERKNNKVIWECLCDCGNTVFPRGTSLTSGATKSCGCLRNGKKRG